MTAVLVDTSAMYAVIDADDINHRAAGPKWELLVDGLEAGMHSALTHYGVVVEATALLQRRLGRGAVRMFHDQMLPAIDLEWIGPDLHARATAALLAAGERGVSLVDWTSFELMRTSGIRTAFAFDDDFQARGFELW